MSLEATGPETATIEATDAGCAPTPEPRSADLALETQQALPRLVVENSPAAIYAKDLEGRYLYGSPFFARAMGVAAEAIVGRTDFDLFPAEHALVLQANDRAAMEAARAVEFEEVVQFPDGPRTFHTVKFALRDAGGSVIGVGGVSTDITDRKRDELRLRASERQLLEAQRVANLGSWEWDPGENRVTWTDELYRIFGLTRAEVEPSYAAYLARIHPEDRDLVRSAIDGACTGRQPFTTECRIVRPDGAVQQIHVRAEPVLGEDGTLRRLVASVQDLTERCEVEERLNQSAKMEAVGRLAGGIAHDFNNLLTAILGYADLAMARAEAGDPQTHGLAQIRKAAERGATLTQQLLAFSRKQILVPEVLDLGVVVADLSKLLWRVIGEEIALSTVIHPGTHPIRADRGQIGQVILNLAVNARDAMPRGGKLVIEVRDACTADVTDELRGRFNPKRFVVLSVSDTGFGMDAKTRRRIFEPFFTTKPKGQGTGLGLATVYGIVEQSGGRIAIHSAPGHGARFDIFLPRSLSATIAAETTEAAAVQVHGTETLILAEDEEIVRRLACEVLEANGYRVIEAANGDQALQLLDRHEGRVDLLLTDVVMPGMSGRELAEQVVARRPGIRVLYMSGYTDDAVVRRGVRAHGLAFLAKPFTPDRLLAKIRAVIDGQTATTP